MKYASEKEILSDISHHQRENETLAYFLTIVPIDREDFYYREALWSQSKSRGRSIMESGQVKWISRESVSSGFGSFWASNKWRVGFG